MSLITCDAHSALAETIFAGGSPNTGALDEERPAWRVEGIEYVYADGSTLTVPDDGEATVDSCDCPGQRVNRGRNIPDGFKPWAGPPIGSPFTFVCDICGVMCECCQTCGVGGCDCD